MQDLSVRFKLCPCTHTTFLLRTKYWINLFRSRENIMSVSHAMLTEVSCGAGRMDKCWLQEWKYCGSIRSNIWFMLWLSILEKILFAFVYSHWLSYDFAMRQIEIKIRTISEMEKITPSHDCSSGSSSDYHMFILTCSYDEDDRVMFPGLKWGPLWELRMNPGQNRILIWECHMRTWYIFVRAAHSQFRLTPSSFPPKPFSVLSISAFVTFHLWLASRCSHLDGLWTVSEEILQFAESVLLNFCSFHQQHPSKTNDLNEGESS